MSTRHCKPTSADNRYPPCDVVQKSEERVVSYDGQAPSVVQKNAKRKSSPWESTSDSAGRSASAVSGPQRFTGCSMLGRFWSTRVDVQISLPRKEIREGY